MSVVVTSTTHCSVQGWPRETLLGQIIVDTFVDSVRCGAVEEYGGIYG